MSLILIMMMVADFYARAELVCQMIDDIFAY